MAVRDPAVQEAFRKKLNSDTFKISLEDPTGAWGLGGNSENSFANLKMYFKLAFAKLNYFFSVGVQIWKIALKAINNSATRAI